MLPENLDLSNKKMVQTDRKITLPDLPPTISAIDKLPLPGDISTSSSKDLKHMFYLPISDQTLLEKMFLNKDEVTTQLKPGDIVDVQLPRTATGTVWNQQKANEAILKLYPNGKIIAVPIIKNVIFKDKRDFHASKDDEEVFFNYSTGPLGERFVRVKSEEEIIKSIQKKWGYKDKNTIKITKNTLDTTGDLPFLPGHSTGQIEWEVSHSEFSKAKVEIVSSIGKDQTFSYENRQLVFDKQTWRSFLNRFGIINQEYVTYNLLESEDFQIDELDEIIIYYVWGNDCKLVSHGSSEYDVKLKNSEDETITKQVIRIY